MKLDSIKDRLKVALESMECQQYGNATLFNADCLDVLRKLPDNSIDSAVFDGPYGIGIMGKEWDNFNPKAIRRATGNYQKGVDHNLQTGRSPSMHAGQYDTTRKGAVKFQQFSYEWAVEVYRVLKPGAHLISFCSPKMYHRMTVGIEDAGFEIRDQIIFLFGTGMPKSHNISKAIDKLHGTEREIVGENPNRKNRRNWDNKPKNITLPATDDSKCWDGWGTGLKPSNEPILLARKPIAEKSIARNVLRYGTGGINIDECKIGEQRRFPSNTIIDEEVADMLKDKAKFFYAPKVSIKERNAGCEHLKAKPQNGKGRTYNDRCAVCKKKFIGPQNTICQCPKGTRKTDKTLYKNQNNHPTVKNLALMEYLVKLVTPQGGSCMDIFMGSGSTGCACATFGFDFIGVERESEYFEIAKARISHWQNVKKVA